MKQQKLSGYQPKYPKKTVRGMALAAAALMTIGTTAGCSFARPQIDGAIAVDDPTPVIEETLPPEDLELEGYVAPEEPPMTPGAPLLPEETPEPEDLRTGGIAMPEETPEPEEIMLMGDVAYFEEP